MIRNKLSILLPAIIAASGLSATAMADYGIRAVDSDSGVIFFQDNNYTGSWNYICYNDNCGAGTLINGYWERSVDGLVDGTTYQIEAKVQDNTIGQYLSGKQSVVFDASNTGGTGTETDTGSATDTDTGSATQTDTGSTTDTGSSTDTGTSEPSTTVVEAESGSLSGDAQIYSDGSASGGQGVAYIYTADSGFTLTNTPAADSLTIKYASQNSGSISVYVNGSDNNVSFSSTGAWVGSYAEVTLDTYVAAGSTVSIQFDNGDAAMNVDTVTFSYSGSSTGTVTGTGTATDTGSATDTDTGSATDTDTGSATDTDTGSATDTDTGSATDTDTGSATDTDTGSATDTDTGSTTDTSTDTGDHCGAPTPDVDPAADLGEGYEAGITTSGIAYHSEIPGASRGFAIWGLQGSAPNLAGQQVLYTATNGTSYYRYEVDLGALDANTEYTLEMRLQGDEFNGGQCISTFAVKPGEGVTDAACYTPSTGGGDNPITVEPVKEQVVATKIVDAQSGLARLVAGIASGDKTGFALYTFDDDQTNVSNCSGICEDFWPKLVIASPDDLVGAGGVTGQFGTIERVTTESVTDDCGVTTTKDVITYHVTYNGQPLYFYRDDTTADDTLGASRPSWQLANANLIEQLPLVKHPHDSLLAPVNGLIPNDMGMAIDIEGRQLTWRPGVVGNNMGGLISQFSPWGGDGYPRSAKDPQLELWCSNNQIQFHMASMPGTLSGPYKAEFPASCYGEFYFFLRYRIYGTVNAEPEDNWVYTALFRYDETKPNDRFDPRTRPTVTYKSANWQRHGHPHSRDRMEEVIHWDAMPYNTSQTSGLERYNTIFVDGPNDFLIQPDANGSILRIEAFEWGAGNCQGPQYIINGNNPMGPNRFDYGQIISWEATFGSSQNNFPGGTSIGSQIYNTMQNTTVGMGFTSATGDPRLNPVDRFGVRMVHANGCNPVEKEERNSRFVQQLTSVQDANKVNAFLQGHNFVHGQSMRSGARPGDTGFAGSTPVVTTTGKVLSGENMGSCGTCHFRDGRSSDAFNTPKGVLMAPGMFGTGLLAEIEGAEVGLTWDGSEATVESQIIAALKNDLSLTPELGDEFGLDVFDMIVTYTETLHVPVRDYDTYLDPEVSEGEVEFYKAGCADCHQTSQKTKASAPVELANIVLRPYTDMKLWDVGTGGNFRTAPLWGLGQNIELLERNGLDTIFLHDGRASTLSEAIDQHASTNGANKAKIIKFLESL